MSIRKELLIGNFLKEKRLEKNLSIRALSNKTNISETSISDYESGFVKPSVINALNLANALDISIKDLFPYVRETIWDTNKRKIKLFDLKSDNFLKHPIVIYSDNIKNDETDIFSIYEDNRLYLFSLNKFNIDESIYLIKNSATGDFKISEHTEDGFEIYAYFIRYLYI